ncbi:hypothetical protein G9C98_005138 [Cotesia typhae]|uniref:Mitochondrial genome maintenance exonuclease 1 n=1 Tax=Cotesia typhae TaxID=2053667 RepID=A0A8J5RLI7_9HYME|nr:hypothetical protein G9C98_005138 [Cotesia typhae]
MRLLVKNKSGHSKKAENIKQLMREQKQMFGPLLEDSKKRKKKLPSQRSVQKIATTNVNDNEEKRKDLRENSEFIWTVKNTGSKKLKIIKKEKVDVPERLKPTYNSIKLILKDITDVRLIESHVVHPTLGYRGIFDCVASYRGNLCLIDWKKSEKIKTLSSIYDSPLQLSAYIGALNSDPNYPFKIKTGILAIAYVEGQPPSIFEFTGKKLEFYWKEWLKRVEKYHIIKSS